MTEDLLKALELAAGAYLPVDPEDVVFLVAEVRRLQAVERVHNLNGHVFRDGVCACGYEFDEAVFKDGLRHRLGGPCWWIKEGAPT